MTGRQPDWPTQPRDMRQKRIIESDLTLHKNTVLADSDQACNRECHPASEAKSS